MGSAAVKPNESSLTEAADWGQGEACGKPGVSPGTGLFPSLREARTFCPESCSETVDMDVSCPGETAASAPETSSPSRGENWTVRAACFSRGVFLERNSCQCPWREQIKGELAAVMAGCDLDEGVSTVAIHARLYNVVICDIKECPRMTAKYDHAHFPAGNAYPASYRDAERGCLMFDLQRATRTTRLKHPCPYLTPITLNPASPSRVDATGATQGCGVNMGRELARGKREDGMIERGPFCRCLNLYPTPWSL